MQEWCQIWFAGIARVAQRNSTARPWKWSTLSVTDTHKNIAESITPTLIKDSTPIFPLSLADVWMIFFLNNVYLMDVV